MLKIDGVKETAIDLGSGRAILILQADVMPSRQRLEQAVLDAGLTLERMERPE